MEMVIRNRFTRETDIGQLGDEALETHTPVVYESRYGLDIGVVLGPVSVDGRRGYKTSQMVHRTASTDDLEQFDRLEGEADRLLATCRERVEAHGLDMRVVGVHYLLDRSKLLIFFVSEHRVDFRGLVRDLVSRLRTRVELRQIGVRDETRMLGGIGVCGRRLCCNGVSDRLGPVSIRMAKDQNYSLNSMKVSGPCGRLLCCLAYEHGHYVEARKSFPREGALVDVDGTVFRVDEINVISNRIRLSGPDSQHRVVPLCALSRIQTNARRRGEPDWALTGDCPAAGTAAGTM